MNGSTETDTEAVSAGSTAVAAELSCGSRLKAARESRGMSIADVAQRLKYAARQVQSIEQGKFDTLPGLTFQRGFVRGYAKLLGLDPTELVSRLDHEVGYNSGPTTTQLQQISYTPATMPTHSRSGSAWPWIFGMLIAIVGIGGYTLYEWEYPGHQPKPRSAQVLQPEVREPSRDIAPTTDASASRPITLPQAFAEFVSPDAGGSVGVGNVLSAGGGTPATGKLHFLFSGESWVEVRQANGSVAYSGVNGAGSEQWVGGQPPFDLVVGNARAVRLVYRGAQIDLEPYTKVTVARLQLK